MGSVAVEDSLAPARASRGSSRRVQAAAKRGLDVAAALVGLAVCWPAMVAIAAAIRLTSRGPVLYRAERTGRYGRPFQMLKFRSMIPHASSLGGSTTGQEDPRVTPVGRFLRRYKLDELPQLINVLRGEMSLVGPRPEVPEYTAIYTEQERRILDCRPGITDLATLEFHDLQSHVGSVDPDAAFREQILPVKNRLRLRYVDEQSFGLDLLILCRTAGIVLAKPLRRMWGWR